VFVTQLAEHYRRTTWKNGWILRLSYMTQRNVIHFIWIQFSYFLSNQNFKTNGESFEIMDENTKYRQTHTHVTRLIHLICLTVFLFSAWRIADSEYSALVKRLEISNKWWNQLTAETVRQQQQKKRKEKERKWIKTKQTIKKREELDNFGRQRDAWCNNH